VLAEAVCWGLPVEGVRSGSHIRVGPLGFFSENVDIVQSLIYWADSATFATVSTPAPGHPSPRGNMGAALTIVRATARLADSCRTDMV
jgi:hypothetical protein